MDEARLEFLFGSVPDAYDDPDTRLDLLLADRPEPAGTWPPPFLRAVVADRILDEAPAQTWEKARRLLASGSDRHAVMDRLVAELLPAVSPDAAVEVYLAVAAEQVAVPDERLAELVTARLDLDPGAPGTAALFGHVDWALTDPFSPVTTAPPDVVVHVPALLDGGVLTHRLSGAEHVEGHLALDADLAPFLRVDGARVPGGGLEIHDDAWCGPEGWLDAFPLDALLAVRCTRDGEVTLAVLDEAPEAAPALVEAVRSVYDTELGEAWLPVPADALVVGLLLRDRETFAGPRPPLTELAAAAGLHRRGTEFAHEESVWAAGAEADRRFRLTDRLGSGAHGEAALAALDALAGPVTDPAELRRVLDLLSDPDVLTAVVDELLEGPDAERVPALVAIADRFVAAAGRTPRAAVAGWIAAVAAERDGRPADAESHLRAAAQVTDGWWLVADRLAWYDSDRGDAAAALGRWLDAGADDDDPDVVAVRPFAVAAGPEPGRNDPCPCGSGRKYKQCHLGRPVAPPLTARLAWLHRKAAGYVERRGGPAADLLELHAEALAGVDASDAELDAAVAHPVVIDTVLHEGGWFARFLADRGPLLPADERELAASWPAVERGVYEVVDDTHVRDVRNGDAVEVSVRPAPVGARVCARAVPDGAGRRVLIGAVTVEPELEEELLAVLADRDAVELLDMLGAGPPPEEPRTVVHGGAPATPVPGAAVPPVVLALRERRENRWCDDPEPALDGLTPRDAAADPARRAELLAVIDALPGDDPARGKLGLRPARLRELLGLG